jgi:hypothetical protein
MSLLEIDQKRGNPDHLDGRITVYAAVDIDSSDLLTGTNHPIASMIHNGLLVAQGNYKEQSSLKDFIQAEMGGSIENGLEEFIEQLGGLEGAFDPEKLREKLHNLDDLKDFIPTPAKIVPFHSEEEILQQPGDIFYVGRFKNIANANLSVNSFPILYQARFRESEIDMIRNEIEGMVALVEKIELPSGLIETSEINIEEKITKEFLPSLIYTRKDPAAFKNAVKKFRKFLNGYQVQEDIEKILWVITKPVELTPVHRSLIELYTKKISEIRKENFSAVEKIKFDISTIEKQISDL